MRDEHGILKPPQLGDSIYLKGQPGELVGAFDLKRVLRDIWANLSLAMAQVAIRWVTKNVPANSIYVELARVIGRSL